MSLRNVGRAPFWGAGGLNVRISEHIMRSRSGVNELLYLSRYAYSYQVLGQLTLLASSSIFPVSNPNFPFDTAALRHIITLHARNADAEHNE